MPLASLKLLLLPLGIAAFVLFLLIIGTIGLGIAMAVISFFAWLRRIALGERKAQRRTERTRSDH